MAQLNGIPLLGKGRIGDFTIYQRDGMTIIRSRHNEKIHPRRPSERQLRQRTRMSNIVNLWKSFPCGQHPAFEQRRNGVTDFNTFVAHAMQAHPIYLTKRQAYQQTCVLTDVVVSQGSLSEIVVNHDGIAPVTSIQLGGLAIDESTTVRQLAMAIVDNNYDYYPGDILRYYLCEQQSVSPDGRPVVVISCTDLVLNPAKQTQLRHATHNSPGFAQRGGQLAASSDVVGGMAWVHLRQKGESLRSSTQRLYCNNNELMALFGSEEAFAKAQESYSGIEN